jgi:hypothetical protein
MTGQDGVGKKNMDGQRKLKLKLNQGKPIVLLLSSTG